MTWRLWLVLVVLCAGVGFMSSPLVVPHGRSALALLVVVLAALMWQWRVTLLVADAPKSQPALGDEQRRQQVYERAQKLARLDRIRAYLAGRQAGRGEP